MARRWSLLRQLKSKLPQPQTRAKPRWSYQRGFLSFHKYAVAAFDLNLLRIKPNVEYDPHRIKILNDV